MQTSSVMVAQGHKQHRHPESGTVSLSAGERPNSPAKGHTFHHGGPIRQGVMHP